LLAQGISVSGPGNPGGHDREFLQTLCMLSQAPQVRSVNVGKMRSADWAGRIGRTAIDKRPVTGPVRVRALGLVGDEIANTKHHGGVHQAVYAFAQEDLDHWTGQLGEQVAPGTFGENLTTVGIDVNDAVLGEKWRIGGALLQVCEVRIPCSVFKNWLGVSGFDDRAWARRFTEHGRPGPYLRVLEEGELQAGDPITVEDRPEHGVTVTDMFRAFTTDPSLLPRLLEVDCVPPKAHAAATAYLHRTGTVAAPAG
jgi:MOSC domain-containing protein YiiM